MKTEEYRCEVDNSREAQREEMLTFFRDNATGGDRENVHSIADELLLTCSSVELRTLRSLGTRTLARRIAPLLTV